MDITARLIAAGDGKLVSSRSVVEGHAYASKSLIDAHQRVPSMQPPRYSRKLKASEETVQALIEESRC